MVDREEKAELVRFNFQNAADFLHTKPFRCSLAGEPLEAKHWSDVLVQVTEFCLAHRAENLRQLYRQPIFRHKLNLPFFMKENRADLSCRQLSNGYWLNLKFDGPHLLQRVAALGKLCGYGPDQIVLYGLPLRRGKVSKHEYASQGDEDMARVGWSMEEAAVLLQSLLWVRDGWIERSAAIAEVSRMLRDYGRVIGREVDDTYRNAAGITWQMAALEYVLTEGKTSRVNTAKWHKDIIALYQQRPKEFHALIQSVSDRLAESEQHPTQQMISPATQLDEEKGSVRVTASAIPEQSVAEQPPSYHVASKPKENAMA